MKKKVNRKPRVNDGANEMWLCRCDCGNEIVVSRKDLQSGKVTSCGCDKEEKSVE